MRDGPGAQAIAACVSAMKSATESCSARLPANSAGTRFQRVVQRFAPLVEGRLHHAEEQGLVTGQPVHGVALHADDGAPHLGRRDERFGLHVHQVFHGIPGLGQHAGDPVHFAARPGGDAVGHLLLEHAHHLGAAIAVVQHLEHDLGADVVREVADDGEGFHETLVQVEPQHIADDEPLAQRGKVFQDVGRSLPVQFHAPEVDVRAGEQVSGERAGPGAHLDHAAIAPVVRERPCDRLRDAVLLQEVLAELFLGADEAHRGCTTSSRVRNAAKRPPKLSCAAAWRRAACSSR